MTTTVSETTPLPAPTAAACVQNDADARDVRAVVTLQIAMTRDMLAYALDQACDIDDSDPDTWSIEYIREGVELELALIRYLELLQGAHRMVDALADESVRERIQAEYRAIDRAYPYLAPEVTA